MGHFKEQMDHQDAVIIAVKSLAYISQSESEQNKFLTETGIDPGQIQSFLTKPEFLSGVLAFLMRDESLLLAFAAHSGLEPIDVEQAQLTLDRAGA